LVSPERGGCPHGRPLGKFREPRSKAWPARAEARQVTELDLPGKKSFTAMKASSKG
jgi:hypothetical protein